MEKQEKMEEEGRRVQMVKMVELRNKIILLSQLMQLITTVMKAPRHQAIHPVAITHPIPHRATLLIKPHSNVKVLALKTVSPNSTKAFSSLPPHLIILSIMATINTVTLTHNHHYLLLPQCLTLL